MKPQIVLTLFALAIMTVIIWDIWLAKDGIQGNTISEVIRAKGKEHPIIPFGIGLGLGTLGGHWFW